MTNKALQFVRAIRWAAVLCQNLAAGLQHTALQLEAELGSPHLPPQAPTTRKDDLPPGEFDDHPPDDLNPGDLRANYEFD